MLWAVWNKFGELYMCIYPGKPNVGETLVFTGVADQCIKYIFDSYNERYSNDLIKKENAIRNNIKKEFKWNSIESDERNMGDQG